MKAMSKKQLADCAGVSVRTLNRWCRPLKKKLQRMGVAPCAKVLPPNVVEYLTKRFCIEVGGASQVPPKGE